MNNTHAEGTVRWAESSAVDQPGARASLVQAETSSIHNHAKSTLGLKYSAARSTTRSLVAKVCRSKALKHRAIEETR